MNWPDDDWPEQAAYFTYRSCLSKRGYLSRKVAKKVCRLTRRHKGDKGLRVYHCRCGLYHLGHYPGYGREHNLVYEKKGAA